MRFILVGLVLAAGLSNCAPQNKSGDRFAASRNAFSESSAEARPSQAARSEAGGARASANGLTVVYSSRSDEETAYLKQEQGVYTLYPFVWDEIPNLDRNPIEGELGIETAGFSALWLDAADFTGDGQSEVFVKIIKNTGEQEGAVYRRTGKRSAQEIFRIASLGEISGPLPASPNGPAGIEVEESSGSQAIKAVYRYSRESQGFIQESQRLAARNAEGVDVRAMNTSQIEEFLRGPWQKAGSAQGQDKVIAFFSPQTRRLVFGQGRMVEILDWQSSVKMASGLLLNTRNSQISYIANNARISVASAKEVDVTFQGNALWSGLYQRMDAQERADSAPQNQPLVNNAPPFSGIYRNAEGSEYAFNYPRFSIEENGRSRSGAFALFSLNGQDVLELRFLDARGFAEERKIYLIEFQEHKEGARLIRTLALTPGSLAVWGAEKTGSASALLEQIEIIS